MQGSQSRSGHLWLVLAAVFGLTGSAYGKITVQETAKSQQYEVTIDGFSKTILDRDGQTFQKIELEGVDGHTGVLYDVGRPALPVVRFTVAGAVQVIPGVAKTSAVDKDGLKYFPNQQSAVKMPGAKQAFVINQSHYATKGFYPNVTYQVEKAGSVRGVQQYLVTLYPVQYSATTGQYTYTDKFTFTVQKGAEKAGIDGAPRFAFLVADDFAGSPGVAEYKAWKESLGFEVVPVSITDAMTPEDVRAELQRLYHEGNLEYALIFGDAEQVPSKGSTIISGVTDHYYRAIDTNDYSSDINGPDIGLGRISVKTESDLQAVVTKYIKYESGLFAEQQWLNGAAFLATNDRHEVAEGSHNYAIDNYTINQGYVGVFPNAEQPGGDKLYAITHSVSNAKTNEVLRMGRTIINYSGHGATTFWDSPGVTQADVRAMDHEDATAFVISNACITGQFTVDESFAETWQRHPAGAVMFWGSMDNTYWDEDDILERAMYDGIYRDGKATFKDITQYALSKHWEHYGGNGRAAYYWETYVVFGDPSLKLRTTYAATPSIEGPEVLPIGIGEARYTIRSQTGQAITGANLILQQIDGDMAFNTTTDANGVGVFQLASEVTSPANFALTVIGQNLARTTSSLQIIPSEQPFLGFSEYSFNGRQTNEAYLGEAIALNFLVTNYGSQGTTGSEVKITDIAGPATVIAGSVALPALAGRAVYQVQGSDLSIAVAEDAMAGEAIEITMEWQTNEGQANQIRTVLSVQKAGLRVAAVDFGATENPDIGGIQPGESGQVYVTIANTGNETITDGTVSFLPGACVAEVSGSVTVASLAPGEKLRLDTPATVTVDGACQNGQLAGLNVALSYESVARSIELESATMFPVGLVIDVFVEHSDIGLEIPDSSDAVEFPIVWERSGLIKDVGITIDLTHTYTGDLTVKLVHPDGTEVMLHNKEGGSNDDIHRTFGRGGDAIDALSQLKGKAAEGTWKIVIQDHASSDTGTLDHINLNLAGYFAD